MNKITVLNLLPNEYAVLGDLKGEQITPPYGEFTLKVVRSIVDTASFEEWSSAFHSAIHCIHPPVTMTANGTPLLSFVRITHKNLKIRSTYDRKELTRA